MNFLKKVFHRNCERRRDTVVQFQASHQDNALNCFVINVDNDATGMTSSSNSISGDVSDAVLTEPAASVDDDSVHGSSDSVVTPSGDAPNDYAESDTTPVSNRDMSDAIVAEDVPEVVAEQKMRLEHLKDSEVPSAERFQLIPTVSYKVSGNLYVYFTAQMTPKHNSTEQKTL